MSICIAAEWLKEKQTECARLARSSNEGTPQHAEWMRLAALMLRERTTHRVLCPACREKVA
jgi:hypothetical protein